MAEAAARPSSTLDGVFAAALQGPAVRRILRNPRFAIPVCMVLICGSFAGSALLQMQLDRAHALGQAAAFERARAGGLARDTAETLDRYARMGRIFADSPAQYRSAELSRAEPAIRDIAVFQDGALVSRLDAADATALPPPAFAGSHSVNGNALSFRDGSRVIEVAFDPRHLSPVWRHAALVPLSQARGIAAAVPGWPLAVMASVDETAALRAWTGTLPIYLFVILGPALAGGWLAALLVGAFERHAKAARAIRALKSTRPVEAKLMVRLANAERGAVESSRAKSEFIAHMSHELRTPLNAVIGFSEIIAEGYFGPPGHPKYAEYARDIADAGRGLHAKIGDILEYANVEAGRYPLMEEAVELAALAAACVDEHQGRAFSRRIALSLDFGEPGAVRADGAAVRRILSNLLANALAYTAEGGFVRADVRFEDAAGVVTLTDSGAGFSPAEARAAGRPFARFDRAGTVTGPGLGLAIAMELARRMGGAMRLAGPSGAGGAVMELRLPRL